MTFFKLLWSMDVLASLVILYFFVTGLADGSVSSRNIGLWLLIVAALAAILFGSMWLKNNQHNGVAIALLLVLAIPAVLFGVYILIAANQKWN